MFYLFGYSLYTSFRTYIVCVLACVGIVKIGGSKHSLVFYTLIELSIGIRVGALAMVSLPKCDPRPLSYG